MNTYVIHLGVTVLAVFEGDATTFQRKNYFVVPERAGCAVLSLSLSNVEWRHLTFRLFLAHSTLESTV